MNLMRRTQLRVVMTLCFSGLSCAVLATPPVPQVTQAVRYDESRPMRDIIAEMAVQQPDSGPGAAYVVPNLFPKPVGAAPLAEGQSQILRGLQLAPSGTPGPMTILSENGISTNGGTPPDTNGDVSPTHFIQWVNTRWAIFNKTTGALIAGPTAGNSFWSGFGGACQNTNRGDPIVLWDDRAQRWVMSQFIVPGAGSNLGSQCFAISASSDPLGTYFRYQFQFPLFGDYPHIGIWTDEGGSQNAYMLVTHEFQLSPAQAFMGAAYIALERDKMLQGLPAAMVRIPGFVDSYGAEPAHLEGPLSAPAGACPTFVHFDAESSEYLFWDMCLNWSTPASSTISATPQRIAARTPFAPFLADVPQLNSVVPLDPFGTHIMYRASARAFPAGAPSAVAMAINHSVEGQSGQGGVRWVKFAFNQDLDLPEGQLLADGFENPAPAGLRKSLMDEGTYVPDAHSRWMGAIAMDQSAGLGLGYSVASPSLNPELRITGRTLDDSAGSLRDEQSCTVGVTGAQTGIFDGRGRWGDYASMSIDPVDNCTFWFTSEYYPTTTVSSWSTRICSFMLPGCGQPTFDLVLDSESRVEMCLATSTGDPTFDLRAGVLAGFNAAVALSSSGLPGGVVPTFVPATINPTPGTSVLTLTGAMSLAPGEYSGAVTGTSGPSTRSLPISLGVSSSATGAPALTLPADLAIGVKVRPVLSWAAAPGALSYLVQVATASDFANIVASASVSSTTWTVDVGLTPSTNYFWRVTPSNYCGDGATSVVRSFTTGVPGTCPGSTTATTVFQDDFQSGINGWVVAGTGGSAWTQGAAIANTGLTTTVWRVIDNVVESNQTLTSPNVVIPAGAQAVILSYDAYHSFELDTATSCWDGAALEAKLIADSNFTYLGAERMLTDAYTGPIAVGAPLAGRSVWCAQTLAPPRRAVVDLDDYAGQTIQLRFRATSDGNTAGAAPTGLHIDNLKVEACQ